MFGEMSLLTRQGTGTDTIRAAGSDGNGNGVTEVYRAEVDFMLTLFYTEPGMREF